MMANTPSSESDYVVAELVAGALRELVDSMHAVCARLESSPDSIGHNEYDRLALLLPSMLGSAEELCRVADGLMDRSGASAVQDPGTLSHYKALALGIAATRNLVQVLLKHLRPQIREHADAIAVIDRLSAKAAPFRGVSS